MNIRKHLAALLNNIAKWIYAPEIPDFSTQLPIEELVYEPCTIQCRRILDDRKVFENLPDDYIAQVKEDMRQEIIDTVNKHSKWLIDVTEEPNIFGEGTALTAQLLIYTKQQTIENYENNFN